MNTKTTLGSALTLLLIATTASAQSDALIAALQTKLGDPTAGPDDRFGSAVGISGDTAIVGAFLKDTHGTDSGAAFVFVRSGATWALEQELRHAPPLGPRYRPRAMNAPPTRPRSAPI